MPAELQHLGLKHQEPGVLFDRPIVIPALTQERLCTATVLAKPAGNREESVAANRLWSYLLQGAFGDNLLRAPLIQQINEMKDAKTVTAYQGDVSEDLIGSLGLIDEDNQDVRSNLRCRTAVATFMSS
eukprot:5219152-Amphidinium_carterae.1